MMNVKKIVISERITDCPSVHGWDGHFYKYKYILEAGEIYVEDVVYAAPHEGAYIHIYIKGNYTFYPTIDADSVYNLIEKHNLENLYTQPNYFSVYGTKEGAPLVIVTHNGSDPDFYLRDDIKHPILKELVEIKLEGMKYEWNSRPHYRLSEELFDLIVIKAVEDTKFAPIREVLISDGEEVEIRGFKFRKVSHPGITFGEKYEEAIYIPADELANYAVNPLFPHDAIELIHTESYSVEVPARRKFIFPSEIDDLPSKEEVEDWLKNADWEKIDYKGLKLREIKVPSGFRIWETFSVLGFRYLVMKNDPRITKWYGYFHWGTTELKGPNGEIVVISQPKLLKEFPHWWVETFERLTKYDWNFEVEVLGTSSFEIIAEGIGREYCKDNYDYKTCYSDNSITMTEKNQEKIFAYLDKTFPKKKEEDNIQNTDNFSRKERVFIKLLRKQGFPENYPITDVKIGKDFITITYTGEEMIHGPLLDLALRITHTRISDTDWKVTLENVNPHLYEFLNKNS